MPKRNYSRDSIGRFASTGSSSSAKAKPMGKRANKEAQSIARMKAAMAANRRDPVADARIRAQTAATKAAEKARSDKAAADYAKASEVFRRGKANMELISPTSRYKSRKR